ERAVEFERLDIRVDYLPFLFHKVRVTEISLVGAKMSIPRRGPTEFDFADVLDRLKGDRGIPADRLLPGDARAAIDAAADGRGGPSAPAPISAPAARRSTITVEPRQRSTVTAAAPSRSGFST